MEIIERVKNGYRAESLRRDALKKAYEDLDKFPSGSEGRTVVLKQIKELNELKPKKGDNRLSPDVVLESIVHITAISLVILAEMPGNVIHSKAYSIASKLRF